MDENENKEIKEETPIDPTEEVKEEAPVESTEEPKEETPAESPEEPTKSPEEEKIEEKINQEPFKENNTNNNIKNNNNTVLIVIIVVIVLAVVLLGSFIIATSIFAKNASNNLFNLFGNTTEKPNEIIDKFNNIVESADSKFENNSLDMYMGTQDGDDVKELLEEVVKLLKKDTAHTIQVIYNTTDTSDPQEITNLKDQFDDDKEYEVSMDYDSNKYINKITITDK